MELCKVAWLEVAYLHQGYSQGISHRQSRSGTAGWSKVQRTSFLLYLYCDMVVGIFRQQGIWISRNRNNWNIHVEYHWNEAKQLIGLATVAQCQNYVFICHYA